jgi:hypothetical protein
MYVSIEHRIENREQRSPEKREAASALSTEPQPQSQGISVSKVSSIDSSSR